MYRFIISLSLLCICSHAQVGVGTNTVDPSAILQVTSDSKGILIPSVAINDAASTTAITTSGTLPNSLLVYNSDITLGKGFYYWNTSSNKWLPIIDFVRLIDQIPLTINYGVQNSTSVSTNNYAGAIAYAENSNSDSDWVYIPGLSQTLEITNLNNDVNFSTEGMVQYSYNKSTAPITINTYSYAVGIFIKDLSNPTNPYKLKAVRTFIVDTPSTCDYKKFYVDGFIQGLAVGNYEVRTYVRLRQIFPTNATKYTAVFGGVASTCSNISEFSGKSYLNISVTQRYN